MLLVALVCLSISNITQKVIEGMQKAMRIEKQKECKKKFYAAVRDGKKNDQILVVIHITADCPIRNEAITQQVMSGFL